MQRWSLAVLATIAAGVTLACGADLARADSPGLWQAYESYFRGARHIDLTHAFEPTQPVWPGFGNAKFKPATAGRDIEGYVAKGEEFTYDKHGSTRRRTGTPTARP